VVAVGLVIALLVVLGSRGSTATAEWDIALAGPSSSNNPGALSGETSSSSVVSAAPSSQQPPAASSAVSSAAPTASKNAAGGSNGSKPPVASSSAVSSQKAPNVYNKTPVNDKSLSAEASPTHMEYDGGNLVVDIIIFNNTSTSLGLDSIDFSVWNRHTDTSSSPQNYYARGTFTSVHTSPSLIPAGGSSTAVLVFTGSQVINPDGDLTCIWWSSSPSASQQDNSGSDSGVLGG
jgi:hypothetical protein